MNHLQQGRYFHPTLGQDTQSKHPKTKMARFVDLGRTNDNDTRLWIGN